MHPLFVAKTAKLYLIMYNALSIIVGVVGPLPPQDEASLTCGDFAQQLYQKADELKGDHPDFNGMLFQCEYRYAKPKVGDKGHRVFPVCRPKDPDDPLQHELCNEAEQ